MISSKVAIILMLSWEPMTPINPLAPHNALLDRVTVYVEGQEVGTISRTDAIMEWTDANGDVLIDSKNPYYKPGTDVSGWWLSFTPIRRKK